MTFDDLIKAGCTVVAGQIDWMNRNIGRCTANGKFVLHDETAEAEISALLAEMVDEDIPPPAPAPAPARKTAKKAQAPADDSVEGLDAMLGT